MNDAPCRRFVACHDCGALTPVRLPTSEDPLEAAEAHISEWYGFFARHALHRLTQLRRLPWAESIGGPVWDPMASTAFELTDGERTFVARATRGSIDDAKVYGFAAGDRTDRATRDGGEIEIDERDVRRALDMEFYPNAIRPSKVDALLTVVHAHVDHLAPDDLEIAFDDADDPDVSIARLPEEAYHRIIEATSRIFDDWERPRVTQFLRENRNEDGLLALRVRRRVVVSAAASFA